MSLESVFANPPSLAGLANNESGEDAKERTPFFFDDDEDTQEYDPDFGKKLGMTEDLAGQTEQNQIEHQPEPPQEKAELDTQPMDTESQDQYPQQEEQIDEDVPVEEVQAETSPKEKSSPDKEGRSSKRRHRSHKSHRHSSRRHRHKSSPTNQGLVPVLEKEDQEGLQKKKQGEPQVLDAENLEDGELEDGEIDDEVQGDDGPPRLSPQVPVLRGSKDAEIESEEEEMEQKESPGKKGDGGSGEENDEKKKAKKRKHEKRKKKKESRAKEKSKRKRPKYTDHDNIEDNNTQQENWMSKGRSPNGHSYKGHAYKGHGLDRSPPGPYDSPYESPPGPYDSPSDEDEYGPPSKMMRRDMNKHRMLDMLGPDYLDPMVDEEEEEDMYSRGRKMGRSKQKKMEKAHMFRDMQRSQGRPDKGGGMLQGSIKQKCKFFMEGKCAKGHNCTFSHDFRPPRKSEVCKFYISDTCAKGKDCLYMHGDYPCKFFHKGMDCAGDKCKFSHDPLDDHTRPIFDKIRDEDQDFVTVMLQQTHQLPYPMPGQQTRSPNKNPNNKRGGGGGGNHGHSNHPPPPQLQHQQPPQQSELKKIPSLFEIEVYPPGKRPGEGGGGDEAGSDSASCLQSPSADDDQSDKGETNNMPRERQRNREMSPPHHSQGPPPQMGGPMGPRPPPPMGGGMGVPPPNMIGGPPPPRMGGPPPMGMRPRFYADMNAQGRPPPPMMGHQPGILGAPPPMLRPPHMNYPPPGDGHHQGPNDYYGSGPGGDQQGMHDCIQSPEHDKQFNKGDMYGIDDQLREMREMSGNPHEDLLGGQPEFPAHLAPKQRELFMRIQQQQRQNVPEPPVNTQQEDKVDVDDNWYSSDEDENGAPKSNLANIIKTLNQKPAAPPQPAPPSGVPFDIAKVLNVIQGVQPQPNQPSNPNQPSPRRDPRQNTQAGPGRSTDPRLLRSDPRTTQRPDPRNEPREQRPDPRLDHRPDPRVREPPTIPIEKTAPPKSNSDDNGAGGDTKFNEAGIRIHSQAHSDIGEVPYQLYKMAISQPTLPHHVNPNDPKFKEDPRIQRQLSGRGYQESRPVRRQSAQSDPRASSAQQNTERYDPRVIHSPSHPSGGMRSHDPRMQKASSVGVAVKQDVDMRLERGRALDPRMSRTFSEPFGVHNAAQQPRLPSSPKQDSDMRTLGLPSLHAGPRDSPPMPSLPPFIPPKPSAPLHKTHSSSPNRSPGADSGNSSSDTNEKQGEKSFSHRTDPRFRKKPKTDQGPSNTSSANNDPRHRKSDSRRAFEHRSPLDSGSKSVSEPSFGSFNQAKNTRPDINDPLRHGDKDERDFSKGNNGFTHRQHQPAGPARHIGMPQISMPSRHSSLRPNSPNPAQLPQTGVLVRTGGPDAQTGIPDDDPNRSMKEVFKTIDPTASPFC